MNKRQYPLYISDGDRGAIKPFVGISGRLFDDVCDPMTGADNKYKYSRAILISIHLLFLL